MLAEYRLPHVKTNIDFHTVACYSYIIFLFA